MISYLERKVASLELAASRASNTATPVTAASGVAGPTGSSTPAVFSPAAISSTSDSRMGFAPVSPNQVPGSGDRAPAASGGPNLGSDRAPAIAPARSTPAASRAGAGDLLGAIVGIDLGAVQNTPGAAAGSDWPTNSQDAPLAFRVRDVVDPAQTRSPQSSGILSNPTPAGAVDNVRLDAPAAAEQDSIPTDLNNMFASSTPSSGHLSGNLSQNSADGYQSDDQSPTQEYVANMLVKRAVPAQQTGGRNVDAAGQQVRQMSPAPEPSREAGGTANKQSSASKGGAKPGASGPAECPAHNPKNRGSLGAGPCVGPKAVAASINVSPLSKCSNVGLSDVPPKRDRGSDTSSSSGVPPPNAQSFLGAAQKPSEPTPPPSNLCPPSPPPRLPEKLKAPPKQAPQPSIAADQSACFAISAISGPGGVAPQKPVPPTRQKPLEPHRGAISAIKDNIANASVCERNMTTRTNLNTATYTSSSSATTKSITVTLTNEALLVTGVPQKLWEDENDESIQTSIEEWGVPNLQQNTDEVSDIRQIGPNSLSCILKASSQST